MKKIYAGPTNCLLLIALLQLVFLNSSCVDTKKVIYFNSTQDMTLPSGTPIPEPVIQYNDILNISVSSLNPEASVVFNAPNISSGTHSGYLVSTDGYIQFPLLGNIKAVGLTKNQLREKIIGLLTEKKLLLSPIVNVQFENFRVTILGEVGHPAVIPVPSEKITLLEAIGTAGDLTLNARRDNVLIIREENGQKVFKHVDLTNKEIFNSPYYYLKSNDVVYVEPSKARIANATSRAPQFLSIGLSAFTVVLTLFTLFKK